MNKKENYLNYVPVKNPEFPYSVGKNGIVTVEVAWKGFYNKIAQRIFHKPDTSHIKLDTYGSFVWQCIDGEKDVFQLSRELNEKFGDVEKGLSRLIKFLEILKDNKFILWK